MGLLRVLWPVIAIELVLKVVALRDLSRREAHELRGGKRWVWVLVILCVSTLGPVSYLVWGRNDL